MITAAVAFNETSGELVVGTSFGRQVHNSNDGSISPSEHPLQLYRKAVC